MELVELESVKIGKGLFIFYNDNTWRNNHLVVHQRANSIC